MSEATTALARFEPSGQTAKSLLAKAGNTLRQNAAALGGVGPGQSRGGVQFVKFDGNTGAFTFGRENHAIPAGQKFAIGVHDLQHGWQFWSNKRPEHDTAVRKSAFEQLGGTPDDRPVQGSNPDPKKNRDGWGKFYSLTFTGIDGGALAGVSLKLEKGSGAIEQLWSDLCMATAENYAIDPNTDFVHPVITIAVGSYENKTHDRTVYTLDHKLIGWTDGETIRELGDAPALDEDQDSSSVLD